MAALTSELHLSTLDATERVLAHARQHGIDSAIDLLDQEIDPACRLHLLEPTRVDWRVMLGMTHDDLVLDVGSGWGRLAFALAPWVGQVYSLEDVDQKLEFQRIMLEQRGDSNVTLIRGGFLDLPVRSAALDWVIFNDEFKAPGDGGAKAPDDIQARVLTRAFELVKPGGHVVIGVENRWGVNVSQRRNRVRRARPEGAGARAFGRDLASCQNLMTRAGADRIHSYAVLPHYSSPRAIIPVSPQCPPAAQKFAIDQVWKRASPAAALARKLLGLLATAGLLRHAFPHYLIVGRRAC